ncbi:MAG: hypothetical protein R3C49_18725 [Planctomycetaceae bacterium]
MTDRLKIAVNGAAGRMGQRVVALTLADPELQLTTALEHAASPRLGQDAGTVCGAGECGVSITSEIVERVVAVFDFSMPEAIDGILAVCEDRRIPLVIATTGFSEE